eukprot:COSAG02_NODE_5818_length_4016_cov_4.946898_4_plen_262_part_01
MAKNPKDAAIHGKKIQSHLRSKTELRSDFLNDKQVLAAMAVSRENVYIRNDDNYHDVSLGSWGDDDNNMFRKSLATHFDIPYENALKATWAYPARSNSKQDDTDETSCKPCNDSIFDAYYTEYDASFSGMKASLDARHQKMDSLKLHIDSGCMGFHPKCPICKSLKRNVRRRATRKDPHRESRVGHTWAFDLITNKTKSLFGNKYTFVMRDFKTGYFKVKHLLTKGARSLGFNSSKLYFCPSDIHPTFFFSMPISILFSSCV